VVPYAFQEILNELSSMELELGGVRNFTGLPRIERKVKAQDFRTGYTDFEYVYLTILGFARLHVHCEEIVSLNNGRKHTQNPGVQMLESKTGMTMHADREGAAHLLRSAGANLLQAFVAARKDKAGTTGFFREAFDRSADPCLEGRANRVLEYLQSRSQVPGAALGAIGTQPPPGDLAVELPAEGASPKAVVGEYLRVFVNECTWRWAVQEGVDYDIAKVERQHEVSLEAFARLCNATTFEVALLARGVATDMPARQWEVQLEDGTWSPYGIETSEALERARLFGDPLCQVKVRHWVYEVHLGHMLQMNFKTKKERPVRCVERCDDKGGGRGRLPLADIKASILYFVELETLAPAKTASTMPAVASRRSDDFDDEGGRDSCAAVPPAGMLPGGVRSSSGCSL